MLVLVPLSIVFILYQSGDLIFLANVHAPAMIGIPWAGGAAFIVVLVLRTSFEQSTLRFWVLNLNERLDRSSCGYFAS